MLLTVTVLPSPATADVTRTVFSDSADESNRAVRSDRYASEMPMRGWWTLTSSGGMASPPGPHRRAFVDPRLPP